jgi:hypothetical protein
VRPSAGAASSLVPQLVDALFETPAMTIGRAETILGVSRRGATVVVERLLGAGVIAEIRSGWRRYFIAEEIIAVANGVDSDVLG